MMNKSLFAALLSLLFIKVAVHAAPSAAQVDTPSLPSPLTEEIINRQLIPNKNCKKIYDLHDNLRDKDGLYVVQPDDDGGEFVVYCDMTAGGWTIIQQRLDSSLDFNQNWDLYEAGFGNLSGNFWLGLEKIRRLANSVGTDQTMELYIDLETFDFGSGPWETFRVYDSFQLVGDDYKLYVQQCFPTLTTDSLMFHNGEPFSTFDRDNDGSSEINCAHEYTSGWWFRGSSCLHSNLNGIYYEKEFVKSNGAQGVKGIVWIDWLEEPLKSTLMAIRPVSALASCAY